MFVGTVWPLGWSETKCFCPPLQRLILHIPWWRLNVIASCSSLVLPLTCNLFHHQSLHSLISAFTCVLSRLRTCCWDLTENTRSGLCAQTSHWALTGFLVGCLSREHMSESPGPRSSWSHGVPHWRAGSRFPSRLTGLFARWKLRAHSLVRWINLREFTHVSASSSRRTVRLDFTNTLQNTSYNFLLGGSAASPKSSFRSINVAHYLYWLRKKSNKTLFVLHFSDRLVHLSALQVTDELEITDSKYALR